MSFKNDNWESSSSFLQHFHEHEMNMEIVIPPHIEAIGTETSTFKYVNSLTFINRP